MAVRGIDVSAYQTVSSWGRVREGGYRYAIVKATEGTSHISDTFFDYYAGARSGGLVVGSYHFARPGGGDARNEARFYVQQLEEAGFRSGRDLPPTLDMEDTGGLGYGDLTNWCLDFVQEVDQQLGLTDPWLRCGLYMNNNYYDNQLNGARVHQGRWLWLAYWPNRDGPWPGEGDIPGGAAIWQWTDRGNVPGIAENTDLNIARDSDFQNLTGGSQEEEEEMPTFRQYDIQEPVQIQPSNSDGPVEKHITFDRDLADPKPRAHEEGSPSYIRRGEDGWAQHELTGMRIEGMAEGDYYAVQIIEVSPDGQEITWSNVQAEGRASTGNEFVSVVRTMRTRKEQRVRWRFIYRGEQTGVKITRGTWVITEW